MDTLFSHVSVVTMDARMSVWVDAFVGVTGSKISYLGKKAPEEDARQHVDGTGMVLMPGLVNAHTHLSLSLLRGCADELGGIDWLDAGIFPRAKQYDARTMKAAVTLSLAESARFGVTSVCCMDFLTDSVCQAIADSGMKANVSLAATMFSGEEFRFDTDPACQELAALYETWHNYDHGRIRVDAALHAEYTSSNPLWDALGEYAAANGLNMQLHLSETKSEHDACENTYGLTPAQLLDCHHVFDVPACCAGCAHLPADDMALLARRRASAVISPLADLKRAGGCADPLAMVKAGMNVCLGADSAADGNSLDLFQQMKAAALIANSKAGKPNALPAEAALMMATVCGAKAQGRQNECGQIAVGMDADLILLDFNQPHLIPCHNVLSNLVYAASGHDVVLTMVRGQIVYFAGKFPTMDLASALGELHAHAIEKVFSQPQEAQSHE